MPEIDIPLFNGVYKNVDQTVANDKSFVLIDGILDRGDGTPSIFSRPGLLAKATVIDAALGTYFPIDGAFWWDEEEIVVVVSGGRIFYSTSSDFTSFTIASAGDYLLNGRRPTFACDGEFLYIANGTRIVKWSPTTAPTYIADTDAPTAVTHVVIFDTYLIANSVGSGTWYFSEPGAPGTWNALDFASAESKPDVVNSIIGFRDEVYIHGRTSAEIWEDDGQTPFAPVAGGAINVGCAAPYSVIHLDNEVIWLSSDRKFVRFAGGGVETLSTQYDEVISDMSVVEDCTADRYDILGKTIVVFQFPSEAKTLAYNITDDNWGEFGYWNTTGFHEAFLGGCHVYVPNGGVHIVGSRKADGAILQMTKDALTDNGTQIRMVSRSGHINYGTNKRKRNENISIRAKRGYVTDATEPVATLRFRDDNGEWSQEIQFSLGMMGDYFNTTRIQRLGMYATRQLEFACTDPVGFVFSEAKEELTVMSR